MIWKIFMAEITSSHMRLFPLQHPIKSRDFDSFLDFLEKLERSFGTIFWYYVQQYEDNFFQCFPGGVTYNFSLETPQNRPKNTNFLNIHQIKNWEYKTLCKNKWLRRWWQNFWVSTNFATFLIKKIMILNIGIWVLKRSVLTRQIQWCIGKII